MGTDPDDEFDSEAFDDLPNTDVAVELHVHFGMAGSFPLRIAELFFADDGLYVAEYGYITPMFGLGTKKHHREADAMARVYEIHGLDEVLVQADKIHWYNYDAIDHVRLDDGGWLGRPKLTVYNVDERSEAYRLHDADLDELPAAVDDCLADHGVEFDHRSGIGFDPVENVHRFFN